MGKKYAQAAGATQDRDEPRDYWKQAFAWYDKAAEKGDIRGQIDVAEAYSYGQGVARDMSKAAEWYQKAADQGDAEAQGRLAMLFSLGQGVPRSDADAYFWFDLAASAESPNRDRYIANRQNVGTRITADELDAVKERLKKWKAAHPSERAIMDELSGRWTGLGRVLRSGFFRVLAPLRLATPRGRLCEIT